MHLNSNGDNTSHVCRSMELFLFRFLRSCNYYNESEYIDLDFKSIVSHRIGSKLPIFFAFISFFQIFCVGTQHPSINRASVCALVLLFA